MQIVATRWQCFDAIDCLTTNLYFVFSKYNSHSIKLQIFNTLQCISDIGKLKLFLQGTGKR